MEEANESGIRLGSLPVINEVLQRGKELNDATLDLRSDLVLLCEEENEVLFHRYVTGVDGTVDLGCVEDAMIVDFVDQLLEVCPRWQAKLKFFLGAWDA